MMIGINKIMVITMVIKVFTNVKARINLEITNAATANAMPTA